MTATEYRRRFGQLEAGITLTASGTAAIAAVKRTAAGIPWRPGKR